MLSGLTAAATDRPSFVLVFTDDQGWADAAFAGHPYLKTPALDRLAREGTWFQQFYVASTVCSPSRAAILSGREPARYHIHGHFSDPELNTQRHMPHWLDPAAPSVARLLRAAGYATAHFGKWHLGSGPGAPEPSAYGFDVHLCVNANGPELGGEGARRDPFFRAKSTAMIVDETIAFMRANRERPFYVHVWTLLPHAPLRPTPEQLAGYSNLCPRADDPAFGPWMQRYLAAAADLTNQMRVYAASITDLDTQLGRLLDAMDELGLSSNTVLFFSSDNGPEDYRISNAANAGVGSTGPLRARKRSLYEGGIRTPGLLRWPGRVPAGRVDRESVLSALDWMPTVCRLAGVEIPPDQRGVGEDVSDIWFGATRPRRTDLHWEWLFRVWGDEYLPPMLAIRSGPWKLFAYHDGSGVELYRIPDDPGETRNLAAHEPVIVSNLVNRLLAWADSLPPSEARRKAAETRTPFDATASARRPPTPQAEARREIFRKKDRDSDGRLTLDEYLDRFPDPVEGRRRFSAFDSNHDGILSEEEFARAGGQ
ncbi:MAG: sulfatase-like hydrolase/transferase [Kiritimatiellae bacterium]|nr:sulfatase-like hydrolase/transferase [Kiritimatiellia bacterium]